VELAIKHGLDGIIISNHGGRQLDSTPATLDTLREVAPVAKGRIPIAVDGGIRRGTDIFKALALGADFCMAGRPALWGLAVSYTLFLLHPTLQADRLLSTTANVA
jgi:(S)-2-hydroxy-acid oxidase